MVYRLQLASRTITLAAGRLPDCPYYGLGSMSDIPVSMVDANSSTSRFSNMKISHHSAQSDQSSSTSEPPFTEPSLATRQPLETVRSLAVSPITGELYIAESRRIWIRRADGRLYRVAGPYPEVLSTAKTNGLYAVQNPPSVEDSHECSNATIEENTGFALDAVFRNINAITVTTFGELIVSDVGRSMVYHIHYHLPQNTSQRGPYRVLSPDTHEIYEFNGGGQLTATKNAITMKDLHRLVFRMHKLLSQITGNSQELKFSIHRDAHGKPLRFETSTGKIFTLNFTFFK
ncbi:unnamed protein product [Protopolystoma xenopodis]|uniref:Teneurin-like YD-shell domain-containing protein n=1 Tax=Protopolystoma xenopodis TaxID=117903 RepID=A0A3S5BVA2_9PLAT|nr:unnamed protein product [Protopolystoma xenopodis]